MSASRLNFNTGAIVNPLEGLQQAVTSVGSTFDKFMQREQDREDRLAREAEDRRRYDNQLSRYDRQDAESLRRFDMQMAQHEADKAQQKDYQNANLKLHERSLTSQEAAQALNSRLHSFQLQDLENKKAARDYAANTGNMDSIVKEYVAGSDLGKSIIAQKQGLALGVGGLQEAAAKAESGGNITESKRLVGQADTLRGEISNLDTKLAEAERAVDKKTLQEIAGARIFQMGGTPTPELVGAMTAGYGVNYAEKNAAKDKANKDMLTLARAMDTKGELYSIDPEGNEIEITSNSQPTSKSTKPKMPEIIVHDGKVESTILPKTMDKTDNLWGLGTTQHAKAQNSLDTMLQAAYDKNKGSFDPTVASFAAKSALVAASRGNEGNNFDESKFKEAFAAFYDEGTRLGSKQLGDANVRDVLLAKVYNNLTPSSEDTAMALKQGYVDNTSGRLGDRLMALQPAAETTPNNPLPKTTRITPEQQKEMVRQGNEILAARGITPDGVGGYVISEEAKRSAIPTKEELQRSMMAMPGPETIKQELVKSGYEGSSAQGWNRLSDAERAAYVGAGTLALGAAVPAFAMGPTSTAALGVRLNNMSPAAKEVVSKVYSTRLPVNPAPTVKQLELIALEERLAEIAAQGTAVARRAPIGAITP